MIDEVKETVTFQDAEVQETAGIATTDTAFIGDDFEDSANLASFLSRPRRVATYIWSQSTLKDTVLGAFDPWFSFFDDERIKRKLDNFAYFRGNLKVKVVVNASPFYHGYAAAIYQPLPNFTPDTIVADSEYSRLIPLSQRPHVWISPQDNAGGELTLPFFFPKNWVTIRSAQEFKDLGRLSIHTFTELGSANGVIGSDVTIQVYAWAEDVKLSGSTLSFAMQSGDEYGTGPISGPATTLSRIAASLEPTFGRFATATRMVMQTTSDVAKMFGFTNVPVIDPPKPVRVAQLANFATTEIGYPVDKLTVDTKNELSVDPTILGLPNVDEMAIKYLVTKPSYYYQFEWSTSDNINDILTYQNVTPMCTINQGITSNGKLYTTPMAYVAGLFDSWRGDIKVTLKFAATQYHKGRVMITYDPQGDATNNVISVVDGSTGAFTIFVDLSERNEVSFVLPYQQALPFQQTSATSFPDRCFQLGPSPVWNRSSTLDNGSFSIRVTNPLSAPVASSTVPVMVIMEGCENLEFQNPTKIDPRLTPFEIQSGDVILGSNEAPIDMKRGLMNFGETIRSLRVLARRTTPNSTVMMKNVGVSGFITQTISHRKMPPYPGFDPGAITTGNKKVGVGTAPYTWANMSPLQYICLMYVAYRGSVMWHYAPDIAFPNYASPMVEVNRYVAGAAYTVTADVSTLTADGSSQASLAALNDNGTNSGMSATHFRLMGTGSVVVPNCSRYLFQSTNPACATTASTADAHKDAVRVVIKYNSQGVQINSSTQYNHVKMYSGAGTDFGCHFFLNTPVLRYTTTVTPAAT